MLSSVPGRCRGITLHQLVREQKIDRLELETRAFVANLPEEQSKRGVRHGGDRLADRGELWPDRGSREGIVEADDREVPRHIEPAPVRDGDDGGGHVVVAREDRRGRALAPEKPLRSLESGAVAEV